jgi:MYXO-CTERM domain-containing protein
MIRNCWSLLLVALVLALPLPGQASVWGGFDSGRVNYVNGLLTGSAHSTFQSRLALQGHSIHTLTESLDSAYLSNVDVFYTSLANTDATPLTAVEQTALSSWVAGGGVWIISGDIFNLPLYNSYGAPFGISNFTAEGPAPTIYSSPVSHPLTWGVASLQGTSYSSWTSGPNGQALASYSGNKTFVEVYDVSSGFTSGGAVLVLGDHNFLTDNFIGQDDNQVFLDNMIAWAGTVCESNDMDGDGVALCEGDCDDNDANNYPGNVEVCDGFDNDCNGLADFVSMMGDDDDSAGDDDDSAGPSIDSEELDIDGDGYLECGDDCDDDSVDFAPNAPELCDGLDNNCDGLLSGDEGDVDMDGQMECEGDCDDGNADTRLGGKELCDGLDNDCDGTIADEEADADGDTWRECDGDCDDDSAEANPDRVEVCDDGIDNDCDALIDSDDVDDCDSPSDDDDSAGDDDDSAGDDDDERRGGSLCGCSASVSEQPEGVLGLGLLLVLGFIRRRA